MNYIKNNLDNILKTISDTEKIYQRIPNSVTLLAVSKKQSIAAIRTAAMCGQRKFGENYLQEALEKITALQDLKLDWHFIGKIQANKTKKIAENFSWVHSICNEKIAKRLNDQRPPHLPLLNVCIEVNIDTEPTKNGTSFAKLPTLALELLKFPRLKLRGIMAIPKPNADSNQQRATFAKLRVAFEDLQKKGLTLDTLSMGTSNDYVAAIAEGATIIRIGTLLFGQRPLHL